MKVPSAQSVTKIITTTKKGKALGRAWKVEGSCDIEMIVYLGPGQWFARGG